MAKSNQNTIIWDIFQGAKKKINPLTYYSMLGGPFFKSHPVLLWPYILACKRLWKRLWYTRFAYICVISFEMFDICSLVEIPTTIYLVSTWSYRFIHFKNAEPCDCEKGWQILNNDFLCSLSSKIIFSEKSLSVHIPSVCPVP